MGATGRRIAIVVLVAYAITPFYWMVITAIKPPAELSEVPPAWVPGAPTLHNFISVWTSIPLAHFMLNSAIVAIITTAVALTISLLAAYGLVRFRFRGRTVVFAVILFNLTLPGVVTLVPFYALLESAGLLNTRIGLALSYTVWAIPFTTLLLRGYLKTAYAAEIEEAALLDGCSRAAVLWRIVIPLSVPGLLSAAIFTVILAWNEFIWASLIATTPNVETASVGLESFVNNSAVNTSLGLWMAGAVYLSLPVVILFLAVQRYVVVAYGGQAPG